MLAIAVHAIVLLGDGFLHPSITDIAIPLASSFERLWMTVGIVAGWAMIVLGLSYYARARIGIDRWRRLHRLTALAWLMGIAHALGQGTDAGQAWFLAATGVAVLPAPLRGYSNVTTLRTIDDARALRAAFAAGGPLVVIGAGFIGQEVAAAARAAGVPVRLVEALPAPLAPLLGDALAGWLTDLHRAHAVEVVLGRTVVGIDGGERARRVVLDDGRRLECAHVVVGVGVRPDIAWTAGNGLGDDGIRVDGGRSDVAATFDPVLGAHVPGAHWEAAGRQGAAAARAMLGHGGGDFRVTYTRGGTPVAVLLANRPQELPSARALLAA